MKRKCFLLLAFLIFSKTTFAGNQAAVTSNGGQQGSIKDELDEVQGEVDKEFSYKFSETREDLAQVKKAVLILTSASGHIGNSKTVRVYWKKAMLKDADAFKKGYLFLAVYSSGEMGDFGTFFAGSKDLAIEDFGMMGFLKIKNQGVVCEDCEGGLWSQTYIKKAAEKLLKRKHFDMVLAK